MVVLFVCLFVRVFFLMRSVEVEMQQSLYENDVSNLEEHTVAYFLHTWHSADNTGTIREPLSLLLNKYFRAVDSELHNNGQGVGGWGGTV